MYNFIVIKKRTILLYLTILLFFTFLIYYFYPHKFSNIKTYNNSSSISTMVDLNGDNEKDSINILKEKENYIIQIKSKNKEYTLKTLDNSPFLGTVSSNWSLQLNTIDLSRDCIPEIIIRTSKDNHPINYIFTWINEEYVNIYSSTDNLLGILDSSNTKTPKINFLSSSKGDDSINSFIFNGNKLKDISFSKPKIPGLTSIQNFIDIIELKYEILEPPNIFSPEILPEDLKILWTLDKDIYRYSFQNGYFTDIKWDDSGDITSLKWTLSFESVNVTNPISEKKEITFSLIAELDNYKEFKISSLKKI